MRVTRPRRARPASPRISIAFALLCALCAGARAFGGPPEPVADAHAAAGESQAAAAGSHPAAAGPHPAAAGRPVAGAGPQVAPAGPQVAPAGPSGLNISAHGALEEQPCRLSADFLPAVLAECSRLVVPEDRSRSDSRPLPLFVARVPAQTATPSPDPLVIIAGGPGQSAVDFYLGMRHAFEPTRRERDIVLLDQRGTGRSADGFRCSFPPDLDVDLAAPEELAAEVRKCLGEIERDPRMFSTSPAVVDLDALRAALGVERWNLYGVSYGTRVAQHYARRYPARTRTLILDGVVPAELVLGPAIAIDAEHALNSIFARCAAESACAARFPELGNRFEVLRTRLAERPVTIELPNPLTGRTLKRRFTETRLLGVVRLMTYAAPTVALLPLAITAAYEGDYRMLAAEAEILLGDTEEAINIPMHNSVVCSEDAPFFSGDPVHGLSLTYLGSSVVDSLATICGVWPAGVVDADFKQPLAFSGPVLLLSGQYDPVTPPTYAERVMAHGLDDAVHLIGPGQGHGMAGVGCVPRLMARFVEAARTAAVDGRCLAAEPPVPFFLSPLGPAP
jgi:pimeloyl-ACP methyl ester carboxylesterase